MVEPAARVTLRRITPRPAWTAARRFTSYIRRLLVWRAILREIAGVSEADQAILRKSARRGRLAALRDIDEWQDPELIADATLRIAGVGDFNARARTDDLYHLLPAREAAVVAAIRARLRRGSTFVDAGANIGFYTVLAANLAGPAGRVVAIEMMPETADRLREHVALNELPNVEVLEHALSNRSGESVEATLPEGKFGRASIVRDADGQRRIVVRTRTLDELLADTPGAIDLIKMDLEGAEAMALDGASAVLQRTNAVIFEQLEGSGCAARRLEEAGFRLHMLDASNVLAERP